jgi:TM2 domain-containing membrane protein YozV
MTAGSFGRKGMAERAVAAPSRRAAFGARNPDHFEAAEIDEAALRRAAFLAGERAREDAPAEPAAPAAPAEPIAPTDRSLTTAYLLWFATGLAGGHRFYLRRPLTGALQAAAFAAGWGAAIAEYYAGFGLVGLSCLWLLADGLLLAHLHKTAGAR